MNESMDMGGEVIENPHEIIIRNLLLVMRDDWTGPGVRTWLEARLKELDFAEKQIERVNGQGPR